MRVGGFLCGLVAEVPGISQGTHIEMLYQVALIWTKARVRCDSSKK